MLQRLLGRTKKKINLALQGGGAHGAFTWGVLDHLLEDGRIHIAGVSGASAGAMNAVMLADGLARGGGEEARKRLAEFWRAASIGGNLPGAQRAVLDRLLALMPVEASPMRFMVDTMSRVLSPYDLNPLNINPLKALIERFVDFDAVRGFKDLDVFISATNVQLPTPKIPGANRNPGADGAGGRNRTSCRAGGFLRRMGAALLGGPAGARARS